ncbi:hypothetical protein FNO01nite_34200 [Flavobacterium noncentrifugens]|nr:hypothetical protein FNO01nite_34200 [Flavobacterium noncentrifugens]
MTENGEEYILISEQSHLDEIINRIYEQKPFANQFKFSKRDFFIALLELLKVNHADFEKKYFYYDSLRKIHISESEFGYVWISTYGLIAKNKATKNRAVNSCLNQYEVISLLFKRAIEVIEDERVYNIDSYSSGLLSKLSPAIFHNLTFYIEVFCKAYLSLTGTQISHTHSLSLIYQKTVETMVSKKHNDSLFQILVLDPLYKFVDHLGKIPGNFKEQYIKYDDNPLDDTIILFEPEGLSEMIVILELSVDFINDYFYIGNKTHYLKTNVFQRMLEKADTEEKKKKIREMYPHLDNGA